MHAARVRSHAQAPARAAVRAITGVYGNAVQVGIPMAAALFGESGLGLHLTIVSLHGLVMLTVLTALVEHDVAGAQPRGLALGQVWRTMLRNIVVHPVVLPLLVGLLFNAIGLRLPELIDQLLQVLGSAVVPVCLVLIGLSLQHYGVRGPVRASIALTANQVDRDAGLRVAAGPLGVRAVGPGAGRGGADGGAAGGQQRVDLRAALSHRRGRGDRGDRDFYRGVCIHCAAVAGCFGAFLATVGQSRRHGTAPSSLRSRPGHSVSRGASGPSGGRADLT